MLSAVRCVCRPGRRLARQFASGQSELVKITEDSDSGMRLASMNRPPVNSLSLELLETLLDTFNKAEKERVPGLVLTSESGTVFSAGLDITEMYKPNMERASKFWTTLQEVWIKLYSSPYPTAAAINGHSPAGGCLLALSCEFRVMVGPKYSIGLNETQLGIIAPHWFQESMRNVLGTRETEKALISGRLYKAEEALKVGLVDALATDKQDAIKQAIDFLESQSNLPPLARSITKQHFRQGTVGWLLKNRDADTKVFLDFIKQPKVQQGLEMYMASLKTK